LVLGLVSVPALALMLGLVSVPALALMLGLVSVPALVLVLELSRLMGMASEWVTVPARVLVENQRPVLVPEWVWD
jgi:hypothetical protein